MDQHTRYLIANARLAALSDPASWTPEELLDVFALANPPVSFRRWSERLTLLGSAAAPTPEPVQDDTQQTMNAILGGKLDHLIKDGVISVQEIKSE